MHLHIRQFWQRLLQIIHSLCNTACTCPHSPAQQRTSCLAPRASVYAGAEGWCFSSAENRTPRSPREHLLNPTPDPASAPSFLQAHCTSPPLCEALSQHSLSNSTLLLPTTASHFGPPNSYPDLLPPKALRSFYNRYSQRDYVFNSDSTFQRLLLFWSSYTNLLSPECIYILLIFYMITREEAGQSPLGLCPMTLKALPPHPVTEHCLPARIRATDEWQRHTTTRCLLTISHLPPCPWKSNSSAATEKFTFQRFAATDHRVNVNCSVLGDASSRASKHKPNARVSKSYVL